MAAGAAGLNSLQTPYAALLSSPLPAQAKMITEENALMYASNLDALKMNLRGIFLDESRRILGI